MADNIDPDYQDYLDYQEYQNYLNSGVSNTNDVSLFNEAAGVTNSVVNGIIDVADFASQVNPLQLGGPGLWGLNKNSLNSFNPSGDEMREAAKSLNLLGEEKARTPVGKVLEGVGYYLPSGVGAGASMPAITGGVFSGVAKAADIGEAGQAAAGMLGGLAPSAGQVLWSKTIGKLPSLFSSQKAAANELRQALTTSELPDLPVGSKLDEMQTLAEYTQNPAIARLEQEVTKRSGGANDTLQALNRDRKEEALKIIQGLSTEGEKTGEAGGQALREVIKPEQQVFKARYEKNFEELSSLTQSKNTQINTGAISEALFKDLNKTYEAGGMPGDLKSIAAEVAAASKIPDSKSTGLINQFGEPVTIPQSKEFGEKPFSWVHALRQRANKAWSDAKTVGDKDAARVAASLVSSIDKTLETQLDGQALATFKTAKKNYSNYMSTFEAKDVGRAIRQHATGDYILNTKQAINAVFDGSPETARQLIKAVGKDSKGREVLAGVLRDKIVRETTKDGAISPGRFRTWLKANKEMLTAEHEGLSLITKEQVLRLENLSSNLELLDPQSARSVKSMAYQASTGQPTTAQAIIQEEASKGILSKVPGLGAYQRYRRGAIDALLGDALLKPSRAALLLSEATPERVKQAGAIYAPQLQSIAQIISEASPPLGTQEKPKQNKEVTKDDKSIRPISLFSPAPTGESFFLDDMKKEFVSDITLDALRQVESGGGKYLKSKAGALGEYQFMPATAAEYGIDPMNPEQARMAARQYLQSSLMEFGGDLRLALASYNAGVGGVKRAIRKAGSTDWDAVKKYLPKETQDYVPKIEAWIKTFRKKEENKPIKV